MSRIASGLTKTGQLEIHVKKSENHQLLSVFSMQYISFHIMRSSEIKHPLLIISDSTIGINNKLLLIWNNLKFMLGYLVIVNAVTEINL